MSKHGVEWFLKGGIMVDISYVYTEGWLLFYELMSRNKQGTTSSV